MGESTDIGMATRLLNGLEQGGLPVAEARILGEDLDPVLVHVIVSFLREVYPATHPAAGPVLERVVELTRAWPGIVESGRRGGDDPVTGWFVSEHGFGMFRGRGAEMLALVVDKLES